MSGSNSSSQASTFAMRALMELTLKVAIRVIGPAAAADAPCSPAAQSTEKLVPQPQFDVAFGFSTAK